MCNFLSLVIVFHILVSLLHFRFHLTFLSSIFCSPSTPPPSFSFLFLSSFFSVSFTFPPYLVPLLKFSPYVLPVYSLFSPSSFRLFPLSPSFLIHPPQPKGKNRKEVQGEKMINMEGRSSHKHRGEEKSTHLLCGLWI